MNKANLKTKWGKYCDTDKLVDEMEKLLKAKNIRCSTNGIGSMLDKFFTNKEPIIEMLQNSDNYAGDLRVVVSTEMNRYANTNEIRRFVNNFCHNVESDKILYKYTDDEGKTINDYFKVGKAKVTVEDIVKNNLPKTKFKNWADVFSIEGVTRDSINRERAFSRIVNCFYYNTSPTVGAKLVSDIGSYDKNIKIAEGMKTSRAFNKVCNAYGIDSVASGIYAKIASSAKFVNGEDVPSEIIAEERKVKSIDGDNVTMTGVPHAISKKYLSNHKYNKLLAEYSDMITESKRNIKFFISVNPIDYLTMSTGRSWSSCHGFGGGYFGGTVSYMLDSVSIITFVHDEIPRNFATEGKIYRNMFHYNDGTLLQSRVYPQGNDGCTDLYTEFRRIMQKEIAQMLGVVNSWNDGDLPKGYLTVNSHGNHYKDYLYGSNAKVSIIGKEKPRGAEITIGHVNVCPNCGREEGMYSNKIAHDRCAEAAN